MRFSKIIIIGLSLCITSTASFSAPNNRPSPLDERGGLPVPKTLADLKVLSLDFWLKYRTTNQSYYRYVNEAAEFHSYIYVCKRHELNIQMGPITSLATQYLSAAIPAHYDDPEQAVLAPLSAAEQTAFINDMSSDLYAFELGHRIAAQTRKVKESGKSKPVYCKGVKNKYYKSYVALLASARKRLKENS
ncbi:MAG: hypothetical protein JKY34_05965 [Kordiimonadaceae bacterium]|nr:hypothetical protein [Kordiimonadaceae bacterium]